MSETGPPCTDQAAADLEQYRQRIDELDKQLLETLNERARAVIEIGRIKRETGRWQIYAPDRERKVIEQIRQYNAGPLPDSCVQAIWRELMSGSFALERPLRIGYLGPAGSFSHLAARRKFGASVSYDDLDTIASVFEAIARGHVDLGLVPVENSSAGGIGETLDAFLQVPVKICAEVLIRIHHNVLAKCEPGEVTRIYSKPEAMGQCRKWLSTHHQQAQRIAVASTSKAAELAAQEQGAAAVGSSLAAEIYDLDVLYPNIEDNPNNITRFVVIAPQDAQPSGDDKTAIMFTTDNKAGALTQVLDVFRDHGINLTHIDKRPSQQINWEYCFFIDCQGHASDPHMQQAIEAARQKCLRLTVLGSFPRATDVL